METNVYFVLLIKKGLIKILESNNHEKRKIVIVEIYFYEPRCEEQIIQIQRLRHLCIFLHKLTKFKIGMLGRGKGP